MTMSILDGLKEKFSAIETELKRRGYRRIVKRQQQYYFVAPWSGQEFEHILIVSHGSSKAFVGLRYALRNDLIEQFSIDCILNFFPWEVEAHDFAKGKRHYCMLAFFPLVDGKKAPWAVCLPECSTDQAVTEYFDKVDKYVEPVLRPIQTIEQFFEALALDSDAFPWWQVSGRIRAAQIIALGAKLQIPEEVLKTRLLSLDDDLKRKPLALRSPIIDSQFDKGLTTEKYLDYLIPASRIFRPH